MFCFGGARLCLALMKSCIVTIYVLGCERDITAFEIKKEEIIRKIWKRIKQE